MTDAMAQLRALASPDRVMVIKAKSAELGDEVRAILDAIALFEARAGELIARRGALLDEWERELDAMEQA